MVATAHQRVGGGLAPAFAAVRTRIGLVVLLVAVICALSVNGTSSEQATRAAIELHAVRRRMDVTEIQRDLRREAIRTRRELADELRDVD